ncbi:MAG TPA: ATP-binding cassette domain-containing protein [Thermoanaerobaculia bacterium]|nr:ATP-binding cassette domain-containing protein [Thermoanaerobaculia bacterium]
MIRVEGLAKRFGSVQALTEVSFAAEDGKITGLLGPNGAGKTTTLRILYGLLKPDTGRARVGDHDVATEPRRAQAALGVLPDQPGLYARLTAREHIEYSGRLHGLSGPGLAQAVDRQLERFGMGEIADRRTAGFSQGERRKVALARALVHEPRHLLLDEPTNGLDAMSARALRREIRALADAGCCVVLSSHQMSEVAALCDTVVIVARGRVAAAGKPGELVERTGAADLEQAFVSIIGSEEGLLS